MSSAFDFIITLCSNIFSLMRSTVFELHGMSFSLWDLFCAFGIIPFAVFRLIPFLRSGDDDENINCKL